MTFRVGQKVELIDDSGKHERDRWEILPVRGDVYTVRWTDGATLRLREIVNREHFYLEGLGELRFRSRRFRPVVERKTDISIFTKMLKPEPIPCH